MKIYEVMHLNGVTRQKWILNINKSIHTVKYELKWSFVEALLLEVDVREEAPERAVCVGIVLAVTPLSLQTPLLPRRRRLP